MVEADNSETLCRKLRGRSDSPGGAWQPGASRHEQRRTIPFHFVVQLHVIDLHKRPPWPHTSQGGDNLAGILSNAQLFIAKE